MITLIADAGSTKTDWCVTDDNGGTTRLSGAGLNPVFMSEDDIVAELRRTVVPRLTAMPTAIRFYGAGCTAEASPRMTAALQVATGAADIEVMSDLVGAARALCGREAGVACILGTGSNSCLYDGRQIVDHVPSLGYIVGDEGSGATLGRRFVGDLFKRQLPATVRTAFLSETGLSEAEVIDRVYRRPLPNRFLASLSPHIARHRSEPSVHRLIVTHLRDFLLRNVCPYEGHERLPIHFTGSIATTYRTELDEAMRELGLHTGRVAKAPMDGLIAYHTRKP